jgi:hypothetical protein
LPIAQPGSSRSASALVLPSGSIAFQGSSPSSAKGALVIALASGGWAMLSRALSVHHHA